jgi:hypothetical protein
MADGIERTDAQQRRRAALAAAFREVTTGPRVQIRPGVTVPVRFLNAR